MADEIVVIGDDGGAELGEEAERDAFMAAGAAGVHEEHAQGAAAEAQAAASVASSAVDVAYEQAASAGDAAAAAGGAADAVSGLIEAHTAAMREQTAAFTALLAEIQQGRQQQAPPATEEKPKPRKADREPRSGRKKFRDAYFGTGR